MKRSRHNSRDIKRWCFDAWPANLVYAGNRAATPVCAECEAGIPLASSESIPFLAAAAKPADRCLDAEGSAGGACLGSVTARLV
jgi:hypothetical protein